MILRRSLYAVTGALLLTLLLLVSQSDNEVEAQTSTFTTAGNHSYTVPLNVYRITITVDGASGGGGGGGGSATDAGGDSDRNSSGGTGGTAGSPGATGGSNGTSRSDSKAGAGGGGGGGGGDSSVSGAGTVITAQGGNGGSGGKGGSADFASGGKGGSGGSGGNSSGSGGSGGSGGVSYWGSQHNGTAGSSGNAGQRVSATRSVIPGTSLSIRVGSGGGGGGGGDGNGRDGADGSAGSAGRVSISDATRGPSAPQSVTATAREGSSTIIDVTWTAPSSSGDADISYYEIQHRLSLGSSWTTISRISGTSRAITGLTAGTAYVVRVRAVNLYRNGSWSSTVSATTNAASAIVPSVPQSVSATARAGSGTIIDVAWAAPSSDGGSAVTHYDIQYQVAGAQAWTPINGITSTSYAVMGLEPDTSYNVQVRAANANGDGPWSSTVSASTPRNVPAVPQSVTATPRAGSGTIIDVSWAAPSSDGGSAVTHYDIRHRVTGTPTWTPINGVTGTSRAVTGLQPNTSYDVQVRAANANGDGAWSSTAIARLSDSTDTTTSGATVSATVAVYSGWRCIRSATARPLYVSNSRLDVHGFCAQTDSNGMNIELHLATSMTYQDLRRFNDVTGAWWVIESGQSDTIANRIYNDRAVEDEELDSLGALAFTEQPTAPQASNRLGFATAVVSATDDDCAENAGRVGFGCNQTNLAALAAGDTGILTFGLLAKHNINFADTPSVPESLSVVRSVDFTAATITWDLFDAATEYELQRLTAVQVDVADVTRIEYGDPVTFTIAGSQVGIRQYSDSGLEAHRTYQYRLRARGADASSWSPWSEYVFSGARPEVDLQAPDNLRLSRDTQSVIASWTAPSGSFDGYTLQRQELLITEGSSFFGNIETLGGDDWLPGDTTMYTDNSILPAQVYEYRIAAVLDDQVGEYSEWFRVGPPITSLGDAPANFRPLVDGARTLDARREFWMGWDAVAGANNYEVQVVTEDLRTGGHSMKEYIVSDTVYFQTSYGTVFLRVRGRKVDANACSAAADNLCLTGWSQWYRARFTPAVSGPDLVTSDDTADSGIAELRAATNEAIEATFGAAGSDVDAAPVIQFLVVTTAFVLGGLSVALTWRRGMAPLGAGMGCAICVLVLFVGYRLWGIPIGWPLAVQVVIAVAGVVALIRQFGLFR